MKECRGVNLGIHQKKLPGFSEFENLEDKKYWQIKKDYVREPTNKS